MVVKINEAVIKDKIYFDEKSVSDVNALINEYTYLDNYCTWSYKEGQFAVPSNSYRKLEINEVEDLRYEGFRKNVYEFTGKLWNNQQEAIDKFFVKENRIRSGILQASCSFGKTWSAIYLIAKMNRNTMILVHTKLLLYQWYEALQKLIPNTDIGLIGDGRCNIKDITVGLYLSVDKNMNQLKNNFGIVIVDEVHTAAAPIFMNTLNNFNSRYKIGLSATPFRKDGKHIMFPDFFTPFKVVGKDENKLIPKYKIIQTKFEFSVLNPNRDWTLAVNRLANNNFYINELATIANNYISEGRCILLLADRVAMLKKLQEKISNSVTLIGETKEERRKEILENAGKKYKCILSTKIFDEGVSCHRLDTLFLTCPFNNYGKLEQRIGRILRIHSDKKEPLIVDFWFNGRIVEGMQNKRLSWYQEQYPD